MDDLGDGTAADDADADTPVWCRHGGGVPSVVARASLRPN
jgi:hypothetical protein